MKETTPTSIELDDLVQTGMVGLLEAVNRLDPARPETQTLFIQRCVRGVILEAIKRDWRHAKAEPIAFDRPDSAEDQETRLIREEEERDMRGRLHVLTRRQRYIMDRYADGEKLAVIARRDRRSLKTISWLKQEALGRLRATFPNISTRQFGADAYYTGIKSQSSRLLLVGPSPVAPVGLDERAADIDEYGRLTAKLAALEPLKARQEQLRGKILSWVPQKAKPEAELTFESSQYSLSIGAREKKRRITSMAALKKVIGWEKFLQNCSITLKALETLVPEPEKREALVVEERTGARRISVAQKCSDLKAA